MSPRSQYSPRTSLRRSLPRSRATALLCASLLAVSTIAAAGAARAATTTLPEGATLGVTIDAPVDGSSVPYGSPVTVTGSANVSKVGGDGGDPPAPNTVLVTVVDLSGSTTNTTSTTACGDPNGDGQANRVLDCEITAALNLSASARTVGTIGEVGAVGFAEKAYAADVVPTAGRQLVTGPASDLAPSAPGADVDEVFRSMGYGSSGARVEKFSNSPALGGNTNFAAALDATRQVLGAATSTNRIVAFISDGLPTTSQNPGFAQVLAALPAGTTVYAFAVGPNAGCGQSGNPAYGSLQQMADATGGTCTRVADPGALPEVLPGIIHPKLTGLSLSVDGGTPTAITNVTPALPQSGPASVDYTVDTEVLMPGDHELCVTASGNDAGGSGQADECATVTVAKVAPTLRTQATPSATVGYGWIADAAYVSSSVPLSGTVTFKLYRPSDIDCSGTPVFTSADQSLSNAMVDGAYVAQSESYNPHSAGEWRWVATYSGDAFNESVTGVCGDPDEVSTVNKVESSIVTTASQSVVVGSGDSIRDTATVTGVNPAGSVTFKAYGPGDTTCAGPAVFTNTVSLTANGGTTSTVQSHPYTPEQAGTYRWIASYSGDAANEPSAGVCNDTGESVEVTKASPSISTTASDGTVVGDGQPVMDTAVVNGGYNPTGTVNFVLYGPGDGACQTPIFNSIVDLDGGMAVSEPYTPTSAGTYRWVAEYSGDGNNNGATGTCGDPDESVSVQKASPELTTSATEFAPLGEPIGDSAVILGGYNPTGSILFELYGPDDPTCANDPVFSHTADVADPTTGDGFAPDSPGVYLWIATYQGDANNVGVAGECGDPTETSIVGKATPILTTRASGDVPVGGTISDTATLTEGRTPTGTVTFLAYGPGDTECTGVPVAASTTALSEGSATSDPYVATAPGVYRWVATYSGDRMNEAVAGACNDPGESVTVTPQVLTGRAFSLDVTGVSLLGIPFTPIHLQNTGDIATTESASYGSGDCIDVDLAIVRAKALCSSVVTDAGYPARSTAKNTVADVSVGVSGLPVIRVKAIESTSTTTCAGSQGSTTIAYLQVGNTVVIGKPTDVAPNTVVLVGAVRLVLNEQIAFSTPDEGLTVNAVHATANLLVLKADIIIASAESDIGNCPAP